ncbi:MAG: 4Fe-4S binding protein [Clostridiales Family XIII bacterium]|jgi:pyruvate ferredoxin oxidoreductase delta subunit|nr:4Fe-4S binding protein [Clostridiales Family XIII bacterium]
MKSINEKSKYNELTEGATIYGGANSVEVKTGTWRTKSPAWLGDICRQCLLCFPTCPDSSIPVKNSKRLDFDFEHCKGCGICAKVCPFGAIIMKDE